MRDRAWRFEAFARERVDFAVIEVGLGGRLDATNVVTPMVSIITRIDFDHENYLGHFAAGNCRGEGGNSQDASAGGIGASNRRRRAMCSWRRRRNCDAPWFETSRAFRVENEAAEHGCVRRRGGGDCEWKSIFDRAEACWPVSVAKCAERPWGPRGSYRIAVIALAMKILPAALPRWSGRGDWNGCKHGRMCTWMGHTIRGAGAGVGAISLKRILRGRKVYLIFWSYARQSVGRGDRDAFSRNAQEVIFTQPATPKSGQRPGSLRRWLVTTQRNLL